MSLEIMGNPSNLPRQVQEVDTTRAIASDECPAICGDGNGRSRRVEGENGDGLAGF